MDPTLRSALTAEIADLVRRERAVAARRLACVARLAELDDDPRRRDDRCGR